MSTHTYIYGILDPRNRALFYIGRSSEPERRFKDHTRLIRSGGRPMQKRVQQIIDAGMVPELVILEHVEKVNAARSEERWIAAFKPTGALYNQREVCAIPRDTPGPRKPKTPEAKTSRGPITTVGAMTPEAMREWREERGWSQARLARHLGVHYSAVSLWESGRRKIPLPIAKLLLQNT